MAEMMPHQTEVPLPIFDQSRFLTPFVAITVALGVYFQRGLDNGVRR